MTRDLVLFLVRHLVFAFLLTVGLRLRLADIRETFRWPLLVARTTLVANLGVPLLAIVLAAALPIDAEATAILLLMAMCPGAPLLLRKPRDRADLPAVELAVVSLLAVLTAPLWASAFAGLFATGFHVPAGVVLPIAVGKVLLPLLLGLTVRRLWPRLADALAEIADLYYKLGLAVALGFFLYIGGAGLLEAQLVGLAGVAALAAGASLLGHWAGRPVPEDRNLSAALAAQGNPALAAAILAQAYPDVHAGAVLAVFLTVRALCLVPYQVWMMRRHRRERGSNHHPGQPAHA